MDENATHQERTQEWSRQACIHAEKLTQTALEQDVLAEVLEHVSLWTEFRAVFRQHMRVWQDLTRVMLAVDGTGLKIGWHVEKRKGACRAQVLTDTEVEKCARGAPQINPGMRLLAILRIPIDKERSFAVARFAGHETNPEFEVIVNHTIGEVIGVLPVMTGEIVPVPTDDANARAAEEMAWQEITEDLGDRIGPDVAAHARDVLKLTPAAAVRDERGCRIYSYRLWRFFTTCDVSIDRGSNEIVGWYIEAFQSEAPKRRISEGAAVASARSELSATVGVCGPSVSFSRTGSDEKVTVHWWHAEHEINVEGDQTTVLLNATTGRIYAVSRKWRDIPADLLKTPAIGVKGALHAADAAIKRDPAQSGGQVMGQNIIQITADPNQPGPVRDLLVWRVGYSEARGVGFTEVSIDCQTGEAVRITGW